MAATQILQFSICALIAFPVPIWLQDLPEALEITLGVLMCLLTAIRLVQELYPMLKEKKHVKLNRYIKCLVREGMVYFIAYVQIFSYREFFYYRSLC